MKTHRNRLTLSLALVLALNGPFAIAQTTPTGAASPQAWSREAMREDLARFRAEFFERDRSYPPQARREAAQRLAALEESAELPSVARFGLELARIAALADNAHTRVDLMALLNAAGRVPLRLGVFGGDFVVLRTKAADADLLGARLVAIDDVPLTRLRDAAHRLLGGLPSWRDRSAPFLFECPEWLQALGLTQQADAAVYRFVQADGRVVQRRLLAEPPSATRARASVGRLLLPEVTPEDAGWRAPLALAQAPWALREAVRSFRWRHDAERDLLVLQMRRVNDAASERLQDFQAEVRSAIADHRPRHLVLDLRDNGGGDLTRGRDFAEALPTLVPGQVFVLTSPTTFSAAISLAGYAKQAAPERVRLVGEAPGDRLEFFAEGRSLVLPNSRVGALPAAERHDYRDGCAQFSDCHAQVRVRPIRVTTLDPDLRAPWTFEAWRRGEDPAMAAVARALAVAPDAAGRWQGDALIPGAAQRVVIDLAQHGASAWVGSITLPGRGVKGAPLDAVVVGADGVRFGIGAAFSIPSDGKAEVVLRWRPDGTLAGEFRQAGNSAPLHLARTGDAQVERVPATAQIEPSLAGTWRGGYVIGDVPREVTLTLANRSGADAGGELLIVGRRTVKLEVNRIVVGRQRVTLYAESAGLRIEGRVDGDTFEGQLLQGPFEPKLVLRKVDGGGRS